MFTMLIMKHEQKFEPFFISYGVSIYAKRHHSKRYFTLFYFKLSNIELVAIGFFLHTHIKVHTKNKNYLKYLKFPKS